MPGFRDLQKRGEIAEKSLQKRGDFTEKSLQKRGDFAEKSLQKRGDFYIFRLIFIELRISAVRRLLAECEK